MRTPITIQQLYVKVWETPFGKMRRYRKTIEILVRTTMTW